MFEFGQVEVTAEDAAMCAGRLETLVVVGRHVAAQRLAYAALWADLHPQPSSVRERPFGADGTPGVAEFAAAELGLLLGTSTGAAASLLRDALDLRHRHPRLWTAVLTGAVEDWAARKTARAAHELTLEAARGVDAACVAALTGLPFGRAMDVVAAAVLAADPEGHAERVAEADRRRYVATTRRENPAGLRTLIAQTSCGDVARFDAMVAHLAGLLLAAGDTDPVQVRRAKAFGMLANPALACVFLARTTDARATRHAARAETDHACTGTTTCCPASTDPEPDDPEPDPDSDPEDQDPEDQDPEPVTAVHAALEVGRLLDAHGPQVLDRLRPRVVLYLHLAEEALRMYTSDPSATGVTSAPDDPEGTPGVVVRAEGLGPLSLPQLRDWLSDRLGVDHVIVKPVLDPTGQAPVDAYEIPTAMRAAMHQLHPYEVWPWGTAATPRADLDHTRPYRDPDRGGPPGQTHPGNLGPLGRHHHRAKTLGGFLHLQPLPGMYLWRTPTGRWYHVDRTGTHPLGTTTPDILTQRRAASAA